MPTFKAVTKTDKGAVQLAEDLTNTADIWEHNIELNDDRVVRLMNVDFNGKEIWQVYENEEKGKLIVTEKPTERKTK